MSNISKKQSPRIDSGQVKHIAKLARIELTIQEEEKFSKELSSILDFIEELKKAKADKMEPILQVANLENVTREDKKREVVKENRRKLLDEVPLKENNYIKVPKVL